jgi:hypothetical protein
MKAVAITIKIVGDAPNDIEPVFRHLLKEVNSPSALTSVDGAEGGSECDE